jgi:HAD superfamily hydrolase (TIGR01509 family)
MANVTALPRDLKAVFVDIGGTLVGPNLGLLGTWLRASGVAFDDAQVRQVEPAARRAHAEKREAVLGTPAIRGLYTREVIRRLWADRPDDPVLLETTANRVLATAIAAGHAVVPVWNEVLPGVREGLATLRARGLPLIAVSNSDGSAESVLVAAGLRELFAAVIDSHHVGFAKPDPRIFDAARAVLGVSADTVVHVGDQYDADVVGAHAAGIAAVLIDSGDQWPDAPCARVDDFDGVMQIITGTIGA